MVIFHIYLLTKTSNTSVEMQLFGTKIGMISVCCLQQMRNMIMGFHLDQNTVVEKCLLVKYVYECGRSIRHVHRFMNIHTDQQCVHITDGIHNKYLVNFGL